MLVGFALILIPVYQIKPVGTNVVLFLFLILGGIYLFSLRIYAPEKFRWKFIEGFSKRWFKRVRNQLHDCGYVFTSDFNNLNVSSDEVQLAIENYFNRYEFEQDLVLTKKKIILTFMLTPTFWN